MARILALLALAGIPLWADNHHYVPDRNAGAGVCDGVLFRRGDLRFQFLIRIQDVHPKMGVPIRINDIAFAPCVTGTFKAVRLQIRMGLTTLTALSPFFERNFFEPPPILVYDGPFTWNATKDTWSPIGLMWPFVTRGMDNVIVEIRYRGGTADIPVRNDTQAFLRIYNFKAQDPFNASVAQGSMEVRGPKVRLSLDDGSSLTLNTPYEHVHMRRFQKVELRGGTPGDTYVIAASLSQTTAAYPVGPCRLNLTPDAVFLYSLLVGTPYFNNYVGTIDRFGYGVGYVYVPENPLLFRLPIYHVAVTLRNGRITACSNVQSLVVYY